MRKLSVCIPGHPDMTCHASVGETVVLPCVSTSSEELNISHSKLYWQKEDDVVHFLHEGHDDLKSQDKQYHGRTSLFLHEVKHGNFSLKLSNVQPQDEAVYSCIYSQYGHQTKISKIKLSVSGKNFFLVQREGAGGSISC
uniref:Ig-like domain-containing protein n=1 Tax=Pavo cristatus TaxID=9049 RepID=A0A8C9FP38_PAVCR